MEPAGKVTSYFGSTDEAILARRRAARPDHPLLSLVIPVHDETDALEPFMEALLPTLDGLKTDVELIFVNDGSTDGTLNLLFNIQETDNRVRIVNLSRNFGKEAALSAGLEATHGDAIVPIDVDLPRPTRTPRRLPRTLDRRLRRRLRRPSKT